MKKLVSILFIFSLFLTMFSTDIYAKGRDVIPNDKTGIPDKALYKAVLNELNRKSGVFTKSEAARITSLDASNYEKNRADIKSLKGIGNLTGLTSLNISYNKLTDLSGIEGLAKLKNLNVVNNKLVNLKGIGNLTGLTSLDVSCNKLTDLSGIKRLTKLENLNVSYNKLTDLSGIEGLTKLERLDVDDNKLVNLKEIKNLKGLKYLEVSLNKLTDLSEVEGLTNLIALYADTNKLTNLSGIDNLTGLVSLNVSFNKLTNLSGIERLTNLEDLGVTGNKLVDLKGIENLTKLSGLGASMNKLTRLPDLKKFTELWFENTTFAFNKLSAKELKNKLPSHLTEDYDWLQYEIKLQNVIKTVKSTKPKSFKKITAKTKKIVGTAHPRASVRLMSGKKVIKTVKSDGKGVFRFEKLNLKKYAGKKIKLQVFVKGYDQGGTFIMEIKSVKFTVKKR